jgi:hypothetical protein
MKKNLLIKPLLVALSVMCSLTMVMAQKAAPLSPAATATGTLKTGANIKISYSSPSVKGRKIWGDLVPFDKLWRAGANAATQIETDKDVTIKGNPLAKGKYSIYAIPSEKDWSIIFSSQTGQSGLNHDGTTTLDSSKELFRVSCKAKKSKTINEKLLYTINEKGFVLSWEYLEVIVPVK